ncbi:TROVE domain protein [compost metagenome]
MSNVQPLNSDELQVGAPVAAAEIESGEQGGHLNFMGGISYDVKHPVGRLRMIAASSFFKEPKYYDDTGARVAGAPSQTLTGKLQSHLQATLGQVESEDSRGQGASSALERAIDEALAADPKATLAVAVSLRNEDFIRVTPQVILVRAAHHPNVRGTGLVREFAPHIIKRGDEPAIQLAYHNATFCRENGKPAPVPNQLKKVWRDYLSKASEYTLAKYRMESAPSKTVDVCNLAHAKSEAIGKLVAGELKLEQRTWESFISTYGSNAESWHQVNELFLRHPGGHMALLRNLRNLEKFGLLDKGTREALVRGAAEGKQLPFRYHSAYQALRAEGASKLALDAVEECLHVSLGALPRLQGRVMSLCDNSGSAHGAFTSEFGSVNVATIANLTGVLTGAMASEEGYVGVFGDKLKRVKVDPAKSVFEQHETVNNLANSVGQSTENGVWVFFRDAIATKEHWDHIFVYSDMQAGHGGLYGVNEKDYADFAWPNSRRHIDVAALVKRYREEVNPNVMVYLVQVAGYQDTLVPDHYDKTVIMGGWSGGILRYAAKMADLMVGPGAGSAGASDEAAGASAEAATV